MHRHALYRLSISWLLTLTPLILLANNSAIRSRNAIVEPIDFSRDIRPILAAKCYACHGPDDGQRQAELRLDVRATAIGELPSGEIAVIPGQPTNSELLRRIASADDDVMPPRETKKTLTDHEKELLHRWIAEGAKYDIHWAFRPPTFPTPPQLRSDWTRFSWPRNVIDQFVGARLEKQSMEPSEEADRVTLIRRLSFDLRGLPPSVEEVESFVNDTSSNSYERVVDYMLASPHYGERLAQDWLDLARYGDTNGYHLDSDRAMWLYRDYVISAFNGNKPFNEFIIENLAGDLLPDATRTTHIASGFNRCATFNEEGGADPDEFYVAYAVDRANTTGQVFLGLTFGCAQCHDHKYDPITQKEYYQFYAFFNSVDGEIGAGGPGGHHNKPLPPLLEVPTQEQEETLRRVTDELTSIESTIAKKLADPSYAEGRKTFATAFATWTEEVRLRLDPSALQIGGLTLWQDAAEFNPSTATWNDKSGLDHNAKVFGEPTLREEGFNGQPTLRLDGEDDFVRTVRGARDLGGAFSMFAVLRVNSEHDPQVIVAWGDETDGGRRTLVKTRPNRLHFATRENELYSGHQIIVNQPMLLGIVHAPDQKQLRFFINGEAKKTVDPKEEFPYSAESITVGAGVDGRNNASMDLSELVIYDRTLSDDEHQKIGRYLSDKYKLKTVYRSAPRAIATIATLKSDERKPEQKKQLRDHFVSYVYPNSREVFAPLLAEQEELQKSKKEAEANIPTTMVMVEMEKRKPAYVLMRGDFQRPGEKVQPDVPVIFPRIPANQPRNRLGLAHWLTRRDHPLVARVTVNRLWKQLFGTGIVKTLGDFGSQGEWPSHRNLLDWLAVDFVEHGWNIKRLQKLFVMSATYRQSSKDFHRYDEIDPYNRLLSRAPRFRLSAEEIRDAALAISGLLVRKVGGHSVRPYQPTDYYKDKVSRGWDQSAGSDLYRRGVYTYWRRTTLYPSFQIFDAPSREVCTVSRPRTNTPLQALVVLNDKTFVEAARVFAERVLRDGGVTIDDKLTYGFRLAVARLPSDTELVVLKSVLAEQQQVYENDPEAAKQLVQQGEYRVPDDIAPTKLAAWTALGNVILNIDETITRE